MKIVAFDPETEKPAWSEWVNGGLTRYGKLVYKTRCKGIDQSFFEGVLALAEDSDLLVIEDQWIHPKATNQFPRVKELVISRGDISRDWLERGKPVVVVQANVWSRILASATFRRRGGKTGSQWMSTEDIRKLSKIRAEDIKKKARVKFGRRIDHNIAAAICMGDWFFSAFLADCSMGGVEVRGGCDHEETIRQALMENLQTHTKRGRRNQPQKTAGGAR